MDKQVKERFINTREGHFLSSLRTIIIEKRTQLAMVIPMIKSDVVIDENTVTTNSNSCANYRGILT